VPRLIDPVVPAGRLAAIAQPTLDLGDLRLRPWRTGDVDVVTEAYADPAIRHWHARSLTRDEASAWIAQWPTRWATETGAGWAVAAAPDDAAIGQISLRRIGLAEGVAEISYWTLPAARGRGTARRALSAVADWSFGELGLHRIEVFHSTQNAASCRVASAAGFALEGTKLSEALHPDGWHDMHMHARVNSG
jgi:RimJ/RimL family protein N-acetyltransferase